MTNTLLLKLEEKLIILLTEVEDLRKEVKELKQENSILKTNHTEYVKKAQELLSLIDAVDLSALFQEKSAYKDSEIENIPEYTTA